VAEHLAEASKSNVKLLLCDCNSVITPSFFNKVKFCVKPFRRIVTQVDACFRPEALVLSSPNTVWNVKPRQLSPRNPAISSYMHLITKQIGISVSLSLKPFQSETIFNTWGPCYPKIIWDMILHFARFWIFKMALYAFKCPLSLFASLKSHFINHARAIIVIWLPLHR